ncbi:predicted protein [Phaeodactylum tricornutum CCAP 1055/1]|uniref:indole-3-glycerol-phosphate synthase n=1 Tax=Phaeodactylum tricornutum (strain CCAP 1055/1) TaxID=556484 RepID=B7G698_PHATC|nr:predicted protein [Phaeodactylum tricornutum CCAP 1055/1]EEC45823.1 predicted protein [Phaeodactylum tricornutum CCAP 1055/1]|eukprot:XP_002182536.1 predicted protein [Phaeodactylum tricornutum CCAP 1055/1]
MKSIVLLSATALMGCDAFQAWSITAAQNYLARSFFDAHRIDTEFRTRYPRHNVLSRLSGSTSGIDPAPQVFASGFSTKTDLVEALQEAVEMAVRALPPAAAENPIIDLCTVSVSSLYDGGSSPPTTVVIPTIVETARSKYGIIQHLIGSSVAGCIASVATTEVDNALTACQPVELDGTPAVSISLAILPDVQLRTFFCQSAYVPDDIGRISPAEWKRAVGLSGFLESNKKDGSDTELSQQDSVVMLLPSPAFSTELDDFLLGLSLYLPRAQTFGGIASTVSSLSRAKLYRYSAASHLSECLSDGCVGVAMTGDIQIQSMAAHGAKPVGGIYQILKGQDSTIGVIVLDETATQALKDEEDNVDNDSDNDSEESEPLDKKAALAQAYAKAQIPKPVLAEANFLMRTLSDEDQAFMRRQLLIGIDKGGSIGRSASELARLSEGEGHRFTVHKVATAGMKDGSVTFSLGSIDVKTGTRMRFFVRDSEFAKKEVEALWFGYKKRLLNQQFGKGEHTTDSTFTRSGCFVIPTLDRGNKFFQGKPGYESGTVARILPTLPTISGFFSNGIIGITEGDGDTSTGVQGSATGYTLIGSKTDRPIFSPAAAAAAHTAAQEEKEAQEAEAEAQALVAEANSKVGESYTQGSNGVVKTAPRSEDGELIIKRREVHSGRAMTVSAVEWSVAEKAAIPTSTLEGFMWDKETEVDRFRERVPLVNLVSQCRLSQMDPKAPKPRGFVVPIQQMVSEGKFVVIPECKRMEPTIGSLRRRYDLSKLARDFTFDGAVAISVNCDAVLFGGSLGDVTAAREAAGSAVIDSISEEGVVVPPILASDLILYPYQLYKLRLAGADAINLLVGALEKKDLSYLTKIASSLQLQSFATVTSEVQLLEVASLQEGTIDGIIVSNRELEDFSFDMTGEQALYLLKSNALAKVRAKHGEDLLILAEGRVGIIDRPQADSTRSAKLYITELREAGAVGAIMGGALAVDGGGYQQVAKMAQL